MESEATARHLKALWVWRHRPVLFPGQGRMSAIESRDLCKPHVSRRTIPSTVAWRGLGFSTTWASRVEVIVIAARGKKVRPRSNGIFRTVLLSNESNFFPRFFSLVIDSPRNSFKNTRVSATLAYVPFIVAQSKRNDEIWKRAACVSFGIFNGVPRISVHPSF